MTILIYIMDTLKAQQTKSLLEFHTHCSYDLQWVKKIKTMSKQFVKIVKEWAAGSYDLH